MDKEKLHKYALNKISDISEIEDIVDWIESSEENQKEFNNIKNLWAYTDFANYDSYANALKDSEKPKKGRTLKWNPAALKYAAILILSFLSGGTAMFLNDFGKDSQLAYNKVIVPCGESAEIILPDKTHVWLNSGSQLVYPSSFNHDTRNVQLIGEALFEVDHNPEKPFHVVTPKLTVEVLGTTFNMEAFSNTKNVNVTLVEGEVNIKNHNGQMLVKLIPNQRVSYNIQSGLFNINSIDSSFYSSWKNGIYNYKDETLADIALKLERLYNVEIVFDDVSIKNIKYTGTILRNKPISQILDVFKFTSEIDYSIEVRILKPNIIHFKKK
ncbi:MAG: FecR family protein [Marinifilum sp.]|jgi:ferric-dicitrate binding protein FerR (iron transport regulator)|nr:FecR family protein [Marinifilum sp.]